MKPLFLSLSLLFVCGSFQPQLAAMASNAPHVAASYQAETKPLTVKKGKKKWRLKERAACFFQKIKSTFHPAGRMDKTVFGPIAWLLIIIAVVAWVISTAGVGAFLAYLGWLGGFVSALIGVRKDKDSALAWVALIITGLPLAFYLVFIILLINCSPDCFD